MQRPEGPRNVSGQVATVRLDDSAFSTGEGGRGSLEGLTSHQKVRSVFIISTF